MRKKGISLKKGIVLMLAIVLAASMLAACDGQTFGTNGTTTADNTAGTTQDSASGTTADAAPEIPNFNPTGYPIVQEPIKLKMFNMINPNGSPYEDLAFFKAMKELTGIDFEFTNVTQAELDTKLGISLASGDFADIYYGMGTTVEDTIFNYGVTGGKFVDYSDLADDYMPNLLSWVDDYPNILKNLQQINGAIYSFPRVLAGAGDTQATLSVRLDKMNEAGITKVPETIEEFYDMCKAIQVYNAKDPEFNVFVSRSVDLNPGRAFENSLVPAFGDYTDANWQVDGNGKVFFNGVTDQVYRYLEFANKLFAEKILYNECYTLEPAANNAMHKANKTAVALSYTLLASENFASGNMDFTLLGPLTSQYSSVKKIIDLPGVQDVGVVISAESKNIEALLRWMDVHYAKEDVAPGLNFRSSHMGIQGENWDYTDATKEFYEMKMPADFNLSATEYLYQKCGPGVVYIGNMTAMMVGASPGLQVKVRDSIKKILPYQVPNFPVLRYTKEENDERIALITDIDSYTKQMRAKFITGDEPLSNFPQYVETMNKMGLPRVTEIMQAAYDRWSGK